MGHACVIGTPAYAGTAASSLGETLPIASSIAPMWGVKSSRTVPRTYVMIIYLTKVIFHDMMPLYEAKSHFFLGFAAETVACN